jgi:hypothetical protein
MVNMKSGVVFDGLVVEFEIRFLDSEFKAKKK